MKKLMNEKGTYITIYIGDDDDKPTLEELQKIVGGYIEVVYAPNGDQIILDEEGRLKGKPINEDASEHWRGDNWRTFNSNIVGDAVVLSGKARLT